MNVKKTILALLSRFKLQITVAVVAIVAVAMILSWLGKTVESASIEIVSDNKIDITPQQIKAIKAIGQWEFLAINHEVMVDSVRRGIFYDDQLVRIYYGTLRLGVDMHRVSPEWIVAKGDTIASRTARRRLHRRDTHQVVLRTGEVDTKSTKSHARQSIQKNEGGLSDKEKHRDSTEQCRPTDAKHHEVNGVQQCHDTLCRQ